MTLTRIIIPNMIRWLPIPILICSCIAAYDYYGNPTGGYFLALIFLPLTIILTLLLMRGLRTELPQQVVEVEWQPFTRWQIATVLLGIVCFVLIAVISLHHALQFVLWLCGVGLIARGMAGEMQWQHTVRLFRLWMFESDARWLLLIILVGLFARVFMLETAIPTYVDETQFAKSIVDLRTLDDVRIMRSMGFVTDYIWIYPYLQFLYTEVFGATLITMRMISVILGTLTIPAVYLLGRWALSRRIGLLAAFLLAIDLPHIHFSRLAMYNIADPLFGVLTIALLWRGLQTRSRSTLALAGVCLGLTGYFYEGGRLLYPALIVCWLLLYTVIQNFNVPKRGIGVFLVTATLVTSCFYISLITQTNRTVAPQLAHQTVSSGFWTDFLVSDDVSAQLQQLFETRINPPYLHIMSQPDNSQFYYSQDVALVLPYLLPLLLIGIGVAFYHGQRLGLAFPLWIMLTVLGNALIRQNDWTPRFVVLLPALAILIALGIDAIYQVIVEQRLRFQSIRKWLQIAGVGVLALMGVLQMDYYFNSLLRAHNVLFREKVDDQDAARRAQALPPDTLVYVLPAIDIYHVDVEVRQAYERHTIPVKIIQANKFDFANFDVSDDQSYAFFVEPDDTLTIAKLRDLFGGCLSDPQGSPYNVPERYQFVLYQMTC